MPTSLWFLNTIVTIKVAHADSQDGASVIEHRVPHGDSPPLHFHRTEDEIFHILEGEFRLKRNDQELRVGPGATLLIPKGTIHSYRVESAQGGRFLTVTTRGEFESFVRALSRPAEHSGFPERIAEPTPEEMHSLSAMAARYGIEMAGPPLS